MQYADYKRAQKYLEALPRQVFAPRHENPELSLERTRRLLAAVGHPEQKLKYVHVTGTSGKGSVTMLVHEILHTAGKHVGSYFSPHVTTTTERIVLNGRLVSVDDFLWAFGKVQPTIEQWKKQDRRYIPSHFEALFAMSLVLFRKHHVQWAVIEVGCGGEFDPTNIIPPPRVAVITNVGLDHQELLGRTKAKIAQTKAKIFKAGSIAISGELDPKIQGIIRSEARRVSIPLTFVQPPTQHVKLTMLGQHQQHDAAIARVVTQHLKIPDATIAKGLRKTMLPARIERIAPNVILDGAHNPDKLRALAKTIRMLHYKRVHILFGVGQNKNVTANLRALLPIGTRWTLTQASLPFPKPLAARRIAKALHALKPKVRVRTQPNAQRALPWALHTLQSNELLLITGSFYLAGELRKHWFSERAILEQQTPFPHATH